MYHQILDDLSNVLDSVATTIPSKDDLIIFYAIDLFCCKWVNCCWQ